MTYALATRNLSVTSLENVIGERSIVVVAPHPDDETLGCGGLLAWASRQGVLSHVVFLTSGEQSHPGTSHNLANIRRAEAVVASASLGLSPGQLSVLGLPDAGLLTLSDESRHWTTHWLRCLAAERRPCVFLVTAETDAHGDHRAAFALVREAIRGLPDVELLTYPIWSWLLPDAPTLLDGIRVDISAYRNEKTAALRAYASQHGERALGVAGFTLPEELLRHANTDTEVLLRPGV
jgi:LmbE family N-acetylglucosaminyl deacetylase